MAGMRLDLRVLAVAGLAAFGLAAPAAAGSDPAETPVTGTHIRPVPAVGEKMQAAQVRLLEKAMASCIVSRSPEMVEKVLANSDAVMIDYEKLGVPLKTAHERLGLNSCLGRVMSDDNLGVTLAFKIGKFRSNLAEESYLRHNPAALARKAWWTEVVANRFLANGGSDAVARLRGSFSDCLAFSDPEKSDALLRTKIESTEEMAAVKALIPAISGCLYEGDKLDINPAMVRQYAADGLWARSYYQGTATAPAAARTNASAKRD